MLRYILADLTLFSPEDDVEQTRKDLCWWLEALTQRNQHYLRQRPDTPRLYKSGVVYQAPKQFDGDPEEVKIIKDALGDRVKQPQVAAVLAKMREVFGGEIFRDIGRIIENGGGDCDNLATWRAAELRQAGIPAKPYMTWRKRSDGGTTYHALVLWPPIPGVDHWTSEDPSLLLGMSQPQRAADRAEEIRKNRERCEHLAGAGLRDRGAALESLLEEVLGLRGRQAAPPSERDLAMRLGRAR